MIVITTPAGQIGSQVLGNLLDSGEQLRVIARDPSQLAAESARTLTLSRARMATRRLHEAMGHTLGQLKTAAEAPAGSPSQP